MTLDGVKKGDQLTILKIEDERARQQAMRLGIYAGASFVCVERIHTGPVVLMGNHSETAIGNRLAKKIHIELAQDILRRRRTT